MDIHRIKLQPGVEPLSTARACGYAAQNGLVLLELVAAHYGNMHVDIIHVRRYPRTNQLHLILRQYKPTLLNKHKNPVLFEQSFLAYARYIFQPYKTAPEKTKRRHPGEEIHKVPSHQPTQPTHNSHQSSQHRHRVEDRFRLIIPINHPPAKPPTTQKSFFPWKTKQVRNSLIP
jgi:hypothetical protein